MKLSYIWPFNKLRRRRRQNGWPSYEEEEEDVRVSGEDVVVAVMGPTGTGKTSFVKTVTADPGIIIGHGLRSETEEVMPYRFTYNGINFVVVDTPGFDDTDDTTGSDTEVLRKVLLWLETSYRGGTKLCGLMYLHRITDPRMGGSAMRNVRMFRKLCGDHCMEKVILATTFWGGVTEYEGRAREDELRNDPDFWGGMVENGATIERLGTDRESCLDLLMRFAHGRRMTLQAQDELVFQNRSIEDTAAAKVVGKELRKVKKQQEAELKAAAKQAAKEVAAREAALRAEEYRREMEMERKLQQERELAWREEMAARQMEEQARAEREHQERLFREEQARMRKEQERIRQDIERKEKERIRLEKEAQARRKKAEWNQYERDMREWQYLKDIHDYYEAAALYASSHNAAYYPTQYYNYNNGYGYYYGS